LVVRGGTTEVMPFPVSFSPGLPFSVLVDVGELSRFSQRAPFLATRRAEVVSGEKQIPHFVRNDKT
jgi:hypothetical protein